MPYKDPTKQKQAQHEHYLNNIDKYKQATKISAPKCRSRKSSWNLELKDSLACIVCGETRYPCLEFHHRDSETKLFSVSTGVWRFAKQKVLDEIAKCDVYCRNCHAFLHWQGKFGHQGE